MPRRSPSRRHYSNSVFLDMRLIVSALTCRQHAAPPARPPPAPAAPRRPRRRRRIPAAAPPTPPSGRRPPSPPPCLLPAAVRGPPASLAGLGIIRRFLSKFCMRDLSWRTRPTPTISCCQLAYPLPRPDQPSSSEEQNCHRSFYIPAESAVRRQLRRLAPAIRSGGLVVKHEDGASMDGNNCVVGNRVTSSGKRNWTP